MLAALLRRGHGRSRGLLSWRQLEVSGKAQTLPESAPSSSPWPSSFPARLEVHILGVHCIPASPGFRQQQLQTLLPLIALQSGLSGPASLSSPSRGLHWGATAGFSLKSRGLIAASSRRALSQASAQRLVPRGGARALEGRFSWKPLTLLWRSAVIASEIGTLWVRRYTEPNIAVRATKVSHPPLFPTPGALGLLFCSCANVNLLLKPQSRVSELALPSPLLQASSWCTCCPSCMCWVVQFRRSLDQIGTLLDVKVRSGDELGSFFWSGSTVVLASFSIPSTVLYVSLLLAWESWQGVL